MAEVKPPVWSKREHNVGLGQYSIECGRLLEGWQGARNEEAEAQSFTTDSLHIFGTAAGDSDQEHLNWFSLSSTLARAFMVAMIAILVA
ncbi:MAG: hypothetical protein FWD79_06570 [Desulfobulbus sp.]|nr:hypothetical protein [Desulfobulbus sp.]